MSKQEDKKKPEKETGKIKGSGSIRGRIKRYPGSQEKKTLKNHVWTRVVFVVEEGTHGILGKKSNHQYQPAKYLEMYNRHLPEGCTETIVAQTLTV